MLCAKGEYHELATLLWGHHEESIVRILTQAWPKSPFSMASLLQAGGLTLVLLAVTFGAHISVGIFMPLVFVGSCFGRAAGHVFKTYISDSIFPGGYALAGAAALLGGVQRGTISLVVILIEGTSNVHMLLPVVTAICVSNFVSNLIMGREGIYDIVIRRKRLRWLEHQPSSLTGVCFAGDVMTRPVITLRAVEKVSAIVEVLRTSPHHGFPVVSLDMPVGAHAAACRQVPKEGAERFECEDGNSFAGVGRTRGAQGRRIEVDVAEAGASVAADQADGKTGGAEGKGLGACPGAQGRSEEGGDGEDGGDGVLRGGRCEGVILRSTLRVLLASRFHPP